MGRRILQRRDAIGQEGAEKVEEGMEGAMEGGKRGVEINADHRAY